MFLGCTWRRARKLQRIFRSDRPETWWEDLQVGRRFRGQGESLEGQGAVHGDISSSAPDRTGRHQTKSIFFHLSSFVNHRKLRNVITNNTIIRFPFKSSNWRSQITISKVLYMRRRFASLDHLVKWSQNQGSSVPSDGL